MSAQDIERPYDVFISYSHDDHAWVRDRLVPTLDAASELVDNLNRVSRDLAEGEGTAGLFLRDERLYEALLLSVQRITDAVDTLRRILLQHVYLAGTFCW